MGKIKYFLFGLLALVGFSAIAISAINSLTTTPYIFIKVCGVVAIIADFFVLIKVFKSLESKVS